MKIACPLCTQATHQQVLLGRPDYEYGCDTRLQYWKCVNGSCGLVFVDPLPSPEVLSSFYQNYTTHISNTHLSAWHLVSKLNLKLSADKTKQILNNADQGTTRILDYGCGNGNFLQQLKKIGFAQVIGYDNDPVACRYAESIGLEAYSDISNIKNAGPYDYVFLNHVIEHLYDLGDIEKMESMLIPGGKIVVRTPNSASFLSRLFRSRWRGWETPRHLQVFNQQSMNRLCERTGKMKIAELSTSNLMFPGVFNGSFHSAFFIHSTTGKILRKLLLSLILLPALFVNLCFSNKGEELVLIAVKAHSSGS